MELVGYVRVSTDRQATHGHSLVAQEAALYAWAAAHDHTLTRVVPDVMSGTKTQQLHGREAAIRLIEVGLADALLVVRYDRVTRSMIDAATLLDRSRARGWSILTTDGKDSGDEGQMLMTDVEMAFAAEERRRISRRTKEGLAAARAEGGGRPGRPSTIPLDVEDAIVRNHEDGMSARAIADDLNGRGVPTPRGGAAWSHIAVLRVVRRVEMAALL